ncbi:hypothetical protein [Pseudoduganella violaceinigra]|nr:hypothetical protein [Pseudoduganella violaceinigra]
MNSPTAFPPPPGPPGPHPSLNRWPTAAALAGQRGAASLPR